MVFLNGWAARLKDNMKIARLTKYQINPMCHIMYLPAWMFYQDECRFYIDEVNPEQGASHE
jgi:hypothetical protein